MAEALDFTSSVIALMQLADRIVGKSSQFIGRVKGAERQVVQVITTITGLKGFLEFLKRFVDDDINAHRLRQLQALSRRDGPLDLCTKLMRDIESTSLRFKQDIHGVLKVLTWTLKWHNISEGRSSRNKRH
jgi:hypothetical protein